jgi:hypothetical protein
MSSPDEQHVGRHSSLETDALLSLRKIERPIGYLGRGIRAGWYPLQGIYYFVRHPEFWPLFRSRILPLSIISLLVYFVLFTFAFLPQFLFLAIWQGWSAWPNAIVLVLGEGLVIIQGLFEGFFVDECRVDIFDVSFPPIPVHKRKRLAQGPFAIMSWHVLDQPDARFTDNV